jgi:hypothetical protein
MTTRTAPARREKDVLAGAGRLGLAVRGATYLIVGLLAILVATHHRTAAPSRQGALQAVVEQPLGRLLALAMAIGFIAFAAWRLQQAVVADEWPKRIANAARAVLYAAFFVSALPFVRHGRGHAASGKKEVDVTARALGWPGGRWLVAAVGLFIIAGGLWNGYRGLSQRYRKRLKWREVGPRMSQVIPVVATAGLVGRMLAFVLVGGFVVNAGYHHRPDEAGGLDAALFRLMARSYGPTLVALVGVGVMLYGAYSLVEARYRDMS